MKDCKSCIKSIHTSDSRLGVRNADRIIESLSMQYLNAEYSDIKYKETKAPFEAFLYSLNQNESWLHKDAITTYRRSANDKLDEIIGEELKIINELDDIYKYVSVGEYYIDDQDGDDLSWWQSVSSVNMNIENRNVFLSGLVTNYGTKTKKIKVIGSVNVREKSKNMWGAQNKIIPKSGEYYAEVEPGKSARFVIMTEYTSKAKNEQIFFWGENSYNVYIDRDAPAKIELEYYDGTISPSLINRQQELVNAYQRTGNVETRKTQWENRYMKSDYATASDIEFEYGEWTTSGGWFDNLPTDATRAKKVKFQCPQNSNRPGDYQNLWIGTTKSGKYVLDLNVCGLFSNPKLNSFSEAQDKLVDCTCY